VYLNMLMEKDYCGENTGRAKRECNRPIVVVPFFLL